MDSLFLQDFVTDISFDNEPFGNLIDSLSERDLLTFEKFLSHDDEGQKTEPGGHIQHGVINFSISKILQNVEEKEKEEEPPGSPESQEPSSPNLSCVICSKPALKYSSYGGQACTSCRSFFRRSARKDVHLQYT